MRIRREFGGAYPFNIFGEVANGGGTKGVVVEG
jgi:hypothetical protein